MVVRRKCFRLAGVIVVCALALVGCSDVQRTVASEPEISISVTSVTEKPEPTDSVSENNKEPDVSVEVPYEKREITFADIPSEFEFSSGVGAWYTEINISEDGSFVGYYEDCNAGNPSEGYYAELYVCNFSGKFSNPEPTDKPYVYSMKLLELSIDDDEEIGTEKILDEVLYIFSEPYGFDDADEFLLYLPGASLSDMTEKCLSWLYFYNAPFTELPAGNYAIYNIGGEEAFYGQNEDSIWYRFFRYKYIDNIIEFVPAYNGSYLRFYEKMWSPVLEIDVPWDGKSTEPIVCSTDSGARLKVTLEPCEDSVADLLKYAITIEWISNPPLNLSEWGSENNSKITARIIEVKD